jgi:hypothetical protein
VIALLLALWWSVRAFARGILPMTERAFTVAMGCVAAFWTIDRVLVLL